MPLNFKKLFAIAPPIKILEQDLVNDNSVLIFVETLDPPIIASFFLEEFLLELNKHALLWTNTQEVFQRN